MKRSLRIAFVYFFWLTFCSSAAVAAPTISPTTSSTLQHGQAVSIFGDSFGIKANPSPQFWDTVENQTAYSALANGATIPTGAGKPWEAQCSYLGGSCVKFITTANEQRGKSKATYKSSDTESGYLEGRTIAATGKMYISWWWKPATDPVSGSHSSKFVRLSNSSDVVNKTFSWTQMHSYAFRTDQGYCQGGGADWATWTGNVNQWNFQEVWIDKATRTYTIRVNGQAIANNVSWSSCTGFDFDHVWSIGWDAGGETPPAITSWMDDIYVDNSFSRVMICNQGTFGGSTHCEMQIPSSWNNSQISLTVNQGTFLDGTTAYLYVVDASGIANSSGYPVAFGTGGTGDVMPPTVTAFTMPASATSLTVAVSSFVATDAVGIAG